VYPLDLLDNSVARLLIAILFSKSKSLNTHRYERSDRDGTIFETQKKGHTRMDLKLKEKNVVITGGSKGIGRATALAMASEGANVAICARGKDPLQATSSELAALGINVFSRSTDVANPEELTAFLNESRESLGSVDILINNTSGFGMTDDEAGWKVSIDVDLMATVRATQQVIPWMEESGGGSIIYVSSISGLESGSPPAYAAVKAALLNYTKTTANLVASKNIRVNCVAPGSIYFKDGFWDVVLENDKDMFDSIVASIPFGRMGTPEEIADVITFMASPRAQWASGATLVVDGVQHKGIY
jgi:3-oxoacyl-[acyl-carrier protein] reductase